MSGIAGIVQLDGRPADREELERLLAAIRARGPDGGGSWTCGPAGLAFAALHTVPESAGVCAPVPSDDGRSAIVADLRLDNRA